MARVSADLLGSSPGRQGPINDPGPRSAIQWLDCGKAGLIDPGSGPDL